MRRASAVLAVALSLLPLAAAAQKVQTNALTPPVLVTTTLSTSVVYLSWSNVAGATAYDVYQKTGGAPFSKLFTTGSTTATLSVAAAATYYYQIVARNTTESVASNVDIATTIVFRDDPLVAGSTPIQDEHVIDLRTAASYARAAAGRPAAVWTNQNIAGALVRTEDIEDLRAAINDARIAAGMTGVAFTDAPLVKGTTVIRKSHMKELRQAVKGVQPGGVLTVTSVAVSEPWFSPNGDAAKDATTVSARASSSDSAWSVTVKTPAGAVVRTGSGSGTNIAFVWDGRDSAGSVVADGSYTFTIQAVDGVYSASSATSAVVDTTAPTATLSAPTAGQTFSNVRQNGSTTLTATGTTADTNLADWDVAYVLNGSATTFGSGQSAVSNAQLGVWNSSGSGANGAYTIRLQVRDKAGNTGTANAAVTLAHFSAAQNVYQIKPSMGEQVTYTSVVPFPLTETLTIRNGAGTAVRTLVNASRGAGTYNDLWNGMSDGGTALPDGPYSYVVTVTEGANVLTWDLSSQMRAGSATQYPYPSCSGRTMPLDTCENHGNAGRQYDPYTNDPLKIHYSVAEPSRVSVLLTTQAETPVTCGGNVLCVVNQEYRAAGNYVDTWSGVMSSGLWDTAARPRITVVRRTDTFPKNVVLIDGRGAAVRVQNLEITPTLYSPEGGSIEVAFDLATFGGAAATVTLQFIKQPDNYPFTVMRTLTLSNQAPGRITSSWDGKAVSGHWIAPGDYSVVVTAATGGLTSTATGRFVVIY